MTDDYVPLTDEQVEEIVLRDEVAFRMHSTRVTQSEMDRAALLADRDYWKRRAEAAERLLTDPYNRELTDERLDSYIRHGTMGLPRNILYAALLRAKRRLEGTPEGTPE